MNTITTESKKNHSGKIFETLLALAVYALAIIGTFAGSVFILDLFFTVLPAAGYILISSNVPLSPLLYSPVLVVAVLSGALIARYIYSVWKCS